MPQLRSQTNINLLSKYELNGVVTKNFKLSVPLDYSTGESFKNIDVFFRVISDLKAFNPSSDREYLLFLQGGPGFPGTNPSSPLSGWMSRAIKDFDIVLLDQRGTGQSSPITCDTLTAHSPAAKDQAEYLSYFRADSIVQDCELIRRSLGLSHWGAVLGQSFGGFCITSYLSKFPTAMKLALFTGGLPPVHLSPEEVYRTTYRACILRNERFYKRYPGDILRVKEVLRLLLQAPVPLPAGGLLTTERFQQLGLNIGMLGGYDQLHYLLECAFTEGPDKLSYTFLRQLESMLSFDTNPLYAILHEAIYCEGRASEWAAERVRREEPYSRLFDASRAMNSSDERPVHFTGEMVFPSMFDGSYSRLASLRETAELIAERQSWPRLYDLDVLRKCEVSAAAAVYAEDMYVDKDASLALARELPNMQVWLTNQYVHSGLRDDGFHILDRLLAMARGQIEIPA
eukprot:CAMPEP_0182433506 /NCGR_PEP_ID=MMETSP1167-20130531/63633_1 /TAXON_ID=2988 /ORGANISM="Mallomonas Sp, Strain CCMP3275" /LENGTH=456 /DNA_ID=CAMNT_0024622271 /DNA_START=140 /DNA_END=1510 /DNA_ORIENTATION=-